MAYRHFAFIDWLDGSATVVDRASIFMIVGRYRSTSVRAKASPRRKPGADDTQSQIGLDRLVPGRSYRIIETDDRFTAGMDGKARLTVALAGRTPLTIVPVA